MEEERLDQIESCIVCDVLAKQHYEADVNGSGDNQAELLSD